MANPAQITINGKLTFWLLTTIFAAGQACIAFALLAVYSMNGAIERIEANRWTSKDQAQWQADHAAVHSSLPPDHVSRAIDDLSRRLRSLEARK